MNEAVINNLKDIHMIVKELITLLSQMPQDLQVVSMGEIIHGCYINEEYYPCDPCRPDAWTIKVVQLI